jgi:hypothetical protein
MEQVSRPVLIALIAVVGFAGAWMLVLRPKAQSESDSSAATPTAVAAAPGTAGLGRAVDKANGAVAASRSSAARAEAAANAAGTADGPAAGPPAPAAAAPKVTPKVAAAPKPAPSPAAAITVLLFAGKGADDQVARQVVRSIRRPGVKTIVAPLSRVSHYAKMIGSVDIPGSPTILVIGADHRAQRIVGLPDEAQVTQALAAARHSG